MKPNETLFKTKKKYAIIMILCFLYGGFALLSFLANAYNFFWETEIAVPQEFNQISDRETDLNRLQNFDNNRPHPPFRRGEILMFNRDPMVLLSSPITLSHLISGILSILAGLAIFGLIREKEIKNIKKMTTENLLLPDEKAVIEALKESDYELTQSKIAKKSGLTKVQVHRALKRLESKGVIEKHDFGLTNKIMLKKEYFE